MRLKMIVIIDAAKVRPLPSLENGQLRQHDGQFF